MRFVGEFLGVYKTTYVSCLFGFVGLWEEDLEFGIWDLGLGNWKLKFEI